MKAAIGQTQNMVTAASQENINLKEESNMKTQNQISKWINGNTTVKMVAGLALGLLLYRRRREDERVPQRGPQRDPLEAARPVHALLTQKYYVDALYEDAVVRRAFYRIIAAGADWLDRNLVDGTVDAIGWIFRNIGSVIGRLQTGQVQAYGTMIALGSLLILLGLLLS